MLDHAEIADFKMQGWIQCTIFNGWLHLSPIFVVAQLRPILLDIRDLHYYEIHENKEKILALLIANVSFKLTLGNTKTLTQSSLRLVFVWDLFIIVGIIPFNMKKIIFVVPLFVYMYM